jgi:hypothetical protein
LSKPRRTVLSGPIPSSPEPEVEEPKPLPKRPRTVQQTVYLPPAVHDQLRELAFSERVKMHALLMEGLDLVFKARGLKPLADLTG